MFNYYFRKQGVFFAVLFAWESCQIIIHNFGALYKSSSCFFPLLSLFYQESVQPFRLDILAVCEVSLGKINGCILQASVMVIIYYTDTKRNENIPTINLTALTLRLGPRHTSNIFF